MSSNKCGSDLTYTLTSDSLEISGSGEMYDYTWNNKAPWYSSESSIKSVTIGNSVTSIGKYAFYWCLSLTTITIPNSVTSIRSSAFRFCSILTTVNYKGINNPGSSSVFTGCTQPIIVNVPVNYNSDDFCGINVSRSLPAVDARTYPQQNADKIASFFEEFSILFFILEGRTS